MFLSAAIIRQSIYLISNVDLNLCLTDKYPFYINHHKICNQSVCGERVRSVFNYTWDPSGSDNGDFENAAENFMVMITDQLERATRDGPLQRIQRSPTLMVELAKCFVPHNLWRVSMAKVFAQTLLLIPTQAANKLTPLLIKKVLPMYARMQLVISIFGKNADFLSKANQFVSAFLETRTSLDRENFAKTLPKIETDDDFQVGLFANLTTLAQELALKWPTRCNEIHLALGTLKSIWSSHNEFNKALREVGHFIFCASQCPSTLVQAFPYIAFHHEFFVEINKALNGVLDEKIKTACRSQVRMSIVESQINDFYAVLEKQELKIFVKSLFGAVSDSSTFSAAVDIVEWSEIPKRDLYDDETTVGVNEISDALDNLVYDFSDPSSDQVLLLSDIVGGEFPDNEADRILIPLIEEVNAFKWGNLAGSCLYISPEGAQCVRSPLPTSTHCFAHESFRDPAAVEAWARMGKINPEAIRFDLVRDLPVSIPFKPNFYKQHSRTARLSETTQQFNLEFSRLKDVLHDMGIQYKALCSRKSYSDDLLKRRLGSPPTGWKSHIIYTAEMILNFRLNVDDDWAKYTELFKAISGYNLWINNRLAFLSADSPYQPPSGPKVGPDVFTFENEKGEVFPTKDPLKSFPIVSTLENSRPLWMLNPMHQGTLAFNKAVYIQIEVRFSPCKPDRMMTKLDCKTNFNNTAYL